MRNVNDPGDEEEKEEFEIDEEGYVQEYFDDEEDDYDYGGYGDYSYNDGWDL